MSEMSSKKRRRGLWWKIPLGLVLLLVALVVVVWMSLSGIATRVANKMLPEVLGTEASVEKIHLQPLRGLAAIHGLKIAQPEGFGEGQALELGKILAKVDVSSLKSAEGILIEAIELQGLTANIEKDADGQLNLAQLGRRPREGEGGPGSGSPSDAGETEDLPAEETEGEDPVEEAEAEAEPFPGIRIARVAVSEIAVSYRDDTTGDKPIEMALGNLDITLTDAVVEIAEGPAARLGSGTVTLEDIHVAQPAGFGDDALLDLRRIHLDIGSEPFVNSLVRLERLGIEGLRAHISRDTNSVMNVARLGGGRPPEAPAEQEEDAAAATNAVEVVAETVQEPATEEAGGETSPVGLYLGELALEDFAVTYSDAALAEEPMDLVVSNLTLNVKDLMVFMKEPPVDSSSIELNAALGQGDYPAALLTLLARVGPIGAGIPEVNAQAKLSGFMLDTAGTLIPPGVRQAAGMNGGGVVLSLAMDEEFIDLQGTVATDAGHAYPIMVKGPLKKPEVNLGPIALAVAGRFTGGVANLATGTTGAAMDVADGVSDGAMDLAKGAGGVAGKVGSGLFKSVKAVATLNLDEVEDGLKEATVDAAKEAGDSIQQAGDNVVETAKDGMSNVSGGKATMEWLEGVPKRHAADVEAARAALKEMPFPPPGLAKK